MVVLTRIDRVRNEDIRRRAGIVRKMSKKGRSEGAELVGGEDG